MSFVLDNSVTMRWLLPNSRQEDNAYASRVLEALVTELAVVPSIWALEVANVIGKAERKALVTEARSKLFLDLLGQLNIVDDKATVKNALGETLSLTRRYFLSAYDASYLELAMRRGLRLATLDQDLIKAANTAGVLIYNPDQ